MKFVLDTSRALLGYVQGSFGVYLRLFWSIDRALFEYV